MRAWYLLFLAGLLEIAWATGLKLSHGLTRPWPALFTAIALILSVGLLGIATKTLPIGTAYAIWVGIGAIGTFFVSVFFFDEALTLTRLGFITLLIIALIGLKLTTPPA